MEEKREDTTRTATTRRRPITNREAIAIYVRDKGICGICNEPVAPADVEIDHIIPVARGGADQAHNLQAAHEECNRRKWAYLPENPTPRESITVRRSRKQRDRQSIIDQATRWRIIFYLAAKWGVKDGAVQDWLRISKTGEHYPEVWLTPESVAILERVYPNRPTDPGAQWDTRAQLIKDAQQVRQWPAWMQRLRAPDEQPRATTPTEGDRGS